MFEFFAKNERFPITHEMPNYFIHRANRGELQEKYGIESTSDFLMKLGILNKTPDGTYVGKEGLDQAAKEIILEFQQSGEWPSSTSQGRIKSKIYDLIDEAPRWSKWGIDTWKDLINYAKDMNKKLKGPIKLSLLQGKCMYCQNDVMGQIHVCTDDKCIKRFQQDTFKVNNSLNID